MRPNIIKVLEENIGRTLFDINHRNIFFDPSRRVMEIKTKNKKWDLIKLKSLCTAKETINKMKRQPTDWEKTLANDMTDKALVAKIYKQFMRFNIIKINNPIKNWAEDLNTHFSKDDIQMADRRMKTCSTLPVTRKMEIRTTMRCHLTPTIMSTFKKSTDKRCWRGCGEKGI